MTGRVPGADGSARARSKSGEEAVRAHPGRKYMPIARAFGLRVRGVQPVDLPGFFRPTFFSQVVKSQCQPADPSAWVVHKFGGSSVADAECFKRVANILETLPPGRLGIVLSACRGVTDALLGLVARAEAQDDAWRGDLDALRARHNTIAEARAHARCAPALHGGLRPRSPRHRRHPAHGQAHAFGRAERARPHRGLWRDLVDQAVP